MSSTRRLGLALILVWLLAVGALLAMTGAATAEAPVSAAIESCYEPNGERLIPDCGL